MTKACVRSVASRLTVFEKTNYKFKNWRHAGAGSIVFPGCGFSSFFPKTLRALEWALHDVRAVGFAYDCCGVPLAGLAGEDAAQRELARVEASLSRAGARELVALCPNCEAAFEGSIACSQTTIYRLLVNLDAAGQVDCGRIEAPGAVFVPCPDKRSRTWLSDLQPFLGPGVFTSSCSACCGAAFELSNPAAADAAARRVLATIARECAERGIADPVAYVYCASCAGKLERARRACECTPAGSVRVVHALSAILGVDEAPAISSSVLNRAKVMLR